GWDAPDLPAHLVERYGSYAREVLALQADRPELAEPIIERLPYTFAEVVYAVTNEMARTVDDVLSRRTRARLLARDASAAAAARVAGYMGDILGWDDAEKQRQAAAYRALIDEERAAGGLPETALDALSQPP